jgi:hypothetical protein
MRPSRSLAAGAERAPIRLHDAKSQFERGSTFSAHHLEPRDDVSAEVELRALGADRKLGKPRPPGTLLSEPSNGVVLFRDAS